MSDTPSDDERGFFRRYGAVIGALGLLTGGGYAVVSFLKGGDKAAPKKAPEMAMVRLAPTPLPELKPKPAEPKPEEPEKATDPTTPKMIDQAPVQTAENKPAEAPAPAAPADAGMGTSIKGDGTGPDWGLKHSLTGGGNTIGGTGTGGTGPGGGGISRWGAYAGRVQSRVSKALAENKATRAAALDLRVRIWADATGHIIRAELTGSTGDADLDTALKGEVLTGITLGEAPPDDMPMPIVMRLTGRRP